MYPFPQVLQFMSACTCGAGTPLVAPPEKDCYKQRGQTQRLWFVKRGQVKFDLADNTNNLPATISGMDPDTQAPWTVLWNATDDTKVVNTPVRRLGAPNIEAGGELTTGGANETPNGVLFSLGRDPSTFSGNFYQLHGDQIAALRDLECQDVEVFLIHEDTTITGHKDGDIFTGIPLQKAAFVSDQTFGNRDNIDANAFNMQFFPKFDELLHTITPTAPFSPLTAVA